jgi:Cd2+/Zn2+-exporting ATPase
MRLPIDDKKFLFLLSSVTIVIILEILSIIGIHIPCLRTFIFAAFIIGIGHEF